MAHSVSYAQVNVKANRFDLKGNPSVVNWYRWSYWLSFLRIFDLMVIDTYWFPFCEWLSPRWKKYTTVILQKWLNKLIIKSGMGFPNLEVRRQSFKIYIWSEGLFTSCDCDCDLFIVTNGLYGTQYHCCNYTAWTLILNSIQLISCDKEITVAIEPCEQASNDSNPQLKGWRQTVVIITEIGTSLEVD